MPYYYMDYHSSPWWPKATDEEMRDRRYKEIKRRDIAYKKLQAKEAKYTLPDWARVTRKDFDASCGPLPPDPDELRAKIKEAEEQERERVRAEDLRLFRQGFLPVLEEWSRETLHRDMLAEDDVALFQKLVEDHGFYIDKREDD